MGADVVIATPGRLLSHLSLGNVDLSHVSFFVLDEADRMLDMGFSDDIMQIVKHLPKERQTIMFSATMPAKIQELARTILHNPAEVKLAVSKPAEKIQQQAYICYETQKTTLLKQIFKERPPHRVIVFASSKLKVKDMAIVLKRAGFKVGAMHSDLTQAERDQVMYSFKSQQLDLLVATDIVARGIDIDDIEMVINFDVPHDAEDYVHRIGRTARAGNQGIAITLVSEKDMPKFNQIEQFLGNPIEKLALPAPLEGPAYNPGQPAPRNRKNSRKKKGNRRKASPDSNKEGTPNKKKEASPQNSNKQTAPQDNNQEAATQKKRRNHRRKNKKPQTPQQS